MSTFIHPTYPLGVGAGSGVVGALTSPPYPPAELIALKGAEGINYIVADSSGSPTANGSALLSAYEATTLLTPNGLSRSATNRAALLIPPGIYNLGTSQLVLDAEFVDIIGLSPDPRHAVITANNPHSATSGTVRVVAHDIRIVGVTLESTTTGSPLANSVGALRVRPESIGASAVCDVNTSTDVITRPGHGLVNNDMIQFAINDSGGQLPTPLVENVWYYVADATTDTFKVRRHFSTTILDLGGSPANVVISNKKTKGLFKNLVLIAPIYPCGTDVTLHGTFEDIELQSTLSSLFFGCGLGHAWGLYKNIYVPERIGLLESFIFGDPGSVFYVKGARVENLIIEGKGNIGVTNNTILAGQWINCRATLIARGTSLIGGYWKDCFASGGISFGISSGGGVGVGPNCVMIGCESYENSFCYPSGSMRGFLMNCRVLGTGSSSFVVTGPGKVRNCINSAGDIVNLG